MRIKKFFRNVKSFVLDNEGFNNKKAQQQSPDAEKNLP